MHSNLPITAGQNRDYTGRARQTASWLSAQLAAAPAAMPYTLIRWPETVEMSAPVAVETEGMRSKWIVLSVIVGSMVLLLRPTPGVDIHGQIQQRLLEAELGSSTTFHFANGPRTG